MTIEKLHIKIGYMEFNAINFEYSNFNQFINDFILIAMKKRQEGRRHEFTKKFEELTSPQYIKRK